MALQIMQQSEEFKISGKLGASNAGSFYTHFKHVMGLQKLLKINIEEVIEIDRSGVNALTQLIDLAKRQNSKLYIVGRGSRDIYDEIRSL